MSSNVTQNKFSAETASKVLRQTLLERLRKNPSYSLRAMAKSLGVSHTYLSLILNGKKPLSKQKAVEFAELLKLNERDARALLKGSKEGRPRSRRDEAPTYNELSVDRFKAVSSWYHLAILDLTGLQQFKSDPTWIAEQLGIHRHQVIDAIERLVRLRLAVYDDKDVLRKSPVNLEVKTKQSNAAVREFHRQMIEKALQELGKTSAEAFAKREISAMTMSINPAKVEAAKKKINRFKQELFAFLSEGPCTDVYQMNIQLFTLLKTEGKQ